MNKIILLVAVTAVTGACAQKPEDIAPAYISPNTYSNLSCDQLREEAARVDAA